MHILRIIGLGGFFLIMGGAAAHAAPIFYALASANVTFHGFPAEQDSETVLVNSSDSAGPVNAALPGASAFASVTDAALHAFATSSGFGTSANASASFFDTLLLTSGAIPDGTHVQLQAQLQFSRTVTPNGVGDPCHGEAVAYAGVDFNNSLGRAGALLVQDHTCNSLDINMPAALIEGIIGEELTLNAFLNAGTSAFLPGTSDAANTSSFLLTPLGNFTYTSASGNTYFAPQHIPVPEPSTLLLLGSGLGFAVSRVRSRFAKR